MNTSPLPIYSAAIVESAAAVYMLKPQDIRGLERSMSHVHARWVAVYLFREFRPKLPIYLIAKVLKRDASTVSHAVAKIPQTLKDDAVFADQCVRAKALALSWPLGSPKAEWRAKAYPNVVSRPAVKSEAPKKPLKPMVHDSVWQEETAMKSSLKLAEIRLLEALRIAHPELEITRSNEAGE